MTLYGLVIFEKGGIEGAKRIKKLTERLNELGIITIEQEKIDRWYQEDCLNRCGCDFHVALHGWKHIRMFRRLMHDEFSDSWISWKTTMKKHPWFKEREKKRAGMKRSVLEGNALLEAIRQEP